MIILGIHGGVTLGQHEPAAAISINGRIVAACEEERFLRIKSCYGRLPVYAIRKCLEIAGINWEDIDLVVSPGATYDDFAARLRRFLTHHFGTVPELQLIHHQMAHLSATFYSSGLPRSLVMSIDATGDGLSGMLGVADRERGIKVLREIPTENSIGFFYTLMTYFLGFEDGDEYKVMGLAPYGAPNTDLSALVRSTEDGWDFDWSMVCDDPRPRSPFEPLYAARVAEVTGLQSRRPDEPLTDLHRNLAASVQTTFEGAVHRLIAWLRAQAPDERSLCLAGGTALNCSANKRIWYDFGFDNVYVPPVASDRGLAIGCAYYGAVQLGDTPWPLLTASLGPSYGEDEIHSELTANGIHFEDTDAPWEAAANLISEGKIIGWHQGRSEVGARALGNRSILASPATIEMRDKVNARIKYREEFRPFAPAVRAERAEEYFDTRGLQSPFMCFTLDVESRHADDIQAVVHVDNTARVQTVRSSDNEPFYALLQSLDSQTGTPVTLNTSFNLKGQPIVETPRDAIMTFFGCGLDALVIGNTVVHKPAA